MLKDKEKLIDEFSTFILRYKNHVEPESRSTANNLLDNILNLLHWYEAKFQDLGKQIDVLIEEKSNLALKLENSENKLLCLKEDLENLLDMPFNSNSNIEAHERVGQDNIINHILQDVLMKYI